MYGFVNRIVELLIVRKYGESVWEEIRLCSGVDITSFSIYERYEDSILYDLVGAAAKVIDIPSNKILELVGEFFYEFAVESGYDRILRALGATPIQFLECLDALHDHLGSAYMGMRAPSFRCTTEETDGKSQFYLHYYSHRTGLGPVVVGLVRASIKGIFNVKVELKDDPNAEHHELGEIRFLITFPNSNDSATVPFQPTKSLFNQSIPPQLIGCLTFAELFPFHILFNRKLVVVQVGKVIARFFPQLMSDGIPLGDVFEITRPRVAFTFCNILSHINTVYVVSERADSTRFRQSPLRLKGQMSYRWQNNDMLFLASPSASSLQGFCDQGVFFSDIPIHDATRNLLLMSEHYIEETEMASTLEMMTNSLQLTYRDLEAEKQKTESLVYAVLPHSIVEDVRHGRKIVGRTFENVSLMFSGINEFQGFCATHAPLEIISLLNKCYTVFDMLLDSQHFQKLYKVETIADHYMVVSGCPEETPDNARIIAHFSLGLLSSCSSIIVDGKTLKITIGIHSGEIVAGVIGERMPRYCLFGDCVNTTSRTEANGKKGCVNLTQTTYDLLQLDVNTSPDFKFTFYEDVVMKGKPQPVPVWLLTRSLVNRLSSNSIIVKRDSVLATSEISPEHAKSWRVKELKRTNISMESLREHGQEEAVPEGPSLEIQRSPFVVCNTGASSKLCILL